MNAKQLITKNTKIGEMVQLYPKTADIMLSWGLSCVGCSINVFESVEDGARVHGQMSDKEIDALLKELNKVAKPIKKLKAGHFYITERALESIKEIALEEKKVGYGLRIKIKVEDNENVYDLQFRKNSKENDEVFCLKGQSLFLDKSSYKRLKGLQMDYLDNNMVSGFKFDKVNN
ncbi:DUF1858 domain-containing protein [Candidatus Dojkabacteria bacterium]|uniref:DUF1858 domain-containing protein n=1 Tax=Candidatus Dojkabacteria bacterium TaxID=2099670 RepID=A0A955L402_9BACT|nr:DUF1858 domain-containing protein [Candidatus Dojkabacteria bacterium]